MLAIIVTGGQAGNAHPGLREAEILKADGTPICRLANMPDNRKYHSQSGLTACGGIRGPAKSCITFKKGVWTKTHNLDKGWFWHSAWSSYKHGTILMGGIYGNTKYSAEVLTENGKIRPSFTLKYELK